MVKVLSFLSALLKNICILHAYHQTKTVDLIQAAGNIFDWVGTTMRLYTFVAANRLATGWHQAGDNFNWEPACISVSWLPTGWRQALIRLATLGVNLNFWKFGGQFQPVGSQVSPACWQPIGSLLTACYQPVGSLLPAQLMAANRLSTGWQKNTALE